MGLIQKYTEDKNDGYVCEYEISFYVATYVKELPSGIAKKIMDSLEKINFELFVLDDDYYYLGGVVGDDNPFFFSVALLMEDGQKPYIADIKSDELDEYLDYVKAKNTIKDYEK
jgi:hypothetical protein